MKKKILAGLFLVTLICGLAFAQDSNSLQAETDASTYSAQNADTSAEEEFGFLLMNYLRDKNPNIVPVTVNFFRERQLVTEDMQMPLVGFYAELFRDKKLREKLLAEIDSLKIKSVSNFFHSVAEFDLDKFYANPEANPNVNDMFWGSYFASGKTQYLDLVIDNAVKYHDEKADMVKFLTGDSACWSLASNAQQYKEVREYLEKSRHKGEAVIDYILNTDPDEIRMNTIFFIQEQKKNGIWQ
ncbi:MAG: hypothetical protein J6Y30_02345 [Treponema sp.]|nr:hypothetical protein [Treponema sp.]